LTFVCSFVGSYDYAKPIQPIFKEFGRRVAHGPRNNPLDLGGNPDHTVPVGLVLRLTFHVVPGSTLLRLGEG